jgi:hypothetical protein
LGKKKKLLPVVSRLVCHHSKHDSGASLQQHDDDMSSVVVVRTNQQHQKQQQRPTYCGTDVVAVDTTNHDGTGLSPIDLNVAWALRLAMVDVNRVYDWKCTNIFKVIVNKCNFVLFLILFYIIRAAKHKHGLDGKKVSLKIQKK